MKTTPNLAALLGGLVLVAMLGLPLRAWAGCEKDTDCKGDRICESGVCQDPRPALTRPPPRFVPSPRPPPAPEYGPDAQFPPPPRFAPPPLTTPSPYAPPGGPAPYYPPPHTYSPPPLYYLPPTYPPPPPAYPPVPRLFQQHETFASSFLALGGVGYLPGQTTFGGVSLERLWLVRMFHGCGVDGGLTFQLGEDLSFDTKSPDLVYLNGGWFGMGFDIGTRYLQFGPRIAVGYLYGASGFQSFIDGTVMIGGHINLWATKSFGFYFEPDAVYDYSHPQWFPRLGGGFAFRW